MFRGLTPRWLLIATVAALGAGIIAGMWVYRIVSG